MNYEEAVAYLLDIPKFTSKNPLTHTKELLRLLGNPQEGKKVIHVAGTNGKGSVCAYLQALLLSEGKQVGFFTSPHLIKMNERIRFNQNMITDTQFLETFEVVYEKVKEMGSEGQAHATFFEFLFAMAMVAFEKENVEYIILETGLGGRLDCTNAVERPFLTIITSISLDHTEILGDTVEKIAMEKAGIIKTGVPVIFDGSDEEAADVIRREALKKQVPCKEISKNAFKILENTRKHIAFSSTNAYYGDTTWRLSNCGLYQAMNAMLALEAFVYIAEERHLAIWKKALEDVHWEGRMEELKPGVILDGSHNPGAIEAFIESVRAFPENFGEKIVLLFSAVKDKHYEKMIQMLCSSLPIHTVVVTKINNLRAVETQELAQVFERYTDAEILAEEDLKKAFVLAEERKGKEGRLYCLGSLYLAGMLKSLAEQEEL